MDQQITLKLDLLQKALNKKPILDLFDTFSPVTRITSIRLLIAIAVIFYLKIHQMDVKTYFLNGDLKEEIYMDQPKGFVELGQESKVCKLTKSLHGLKQAPKCMKSLIPTQLRMVINQMNAINVFILNHRIIYMLLLASMQMIC